ncbi:MAG: hypothetical protein NUV63_01055 [Gallionella sp.]|nr:hypothetical protein [Gallionella sp.]
MKSSHLLRIGQDSGVIMRSLALVPLFFTLVIGAAHAEEVPPFNINMDRVEMNHKGDFGDSKAYFIPTVYLRITARTETSAQTGGSSGAFAKAKILIDGLDKSLLQGLAKKVYDDLVAKIRASGFTVLTYDDMKTELAGLDRMKPNEKFGFPTSLLEGGSGVDYAIITPSDEQTFDWGVTGMTYRYRDIAKKKDVVVLVPDIRFSLTEVLSKDTGSFFTKSVELNVLPPMRLNWAIVYALPPDWGGGDIRIKEHGKRLAAEVAGSVKKVSEDKADYAGWARATGDYVFTIDPAAVSTGILRVGYAINDLTVKTIKKEHD